MLLHESSLLSFRAGRLSFYLVLILEAGHDTDSALVSGTAIEAPFIVRQLDMCRAKRQILILDCCYSGAFSRGAKGAAPAVTLNTFAGDGFGRVILTATDATQMAWEGNRILQTPTANSVFTHYLLEGLSTGQADTDGDGFVDVDELYEYAFASIRSQTSQQTPRKWSVNQQGRILLAKRAEPGQTAQVTEAENAALRILVTGGLDVSTDMARLAGMLGREVIAKGHTLINFGSRGVDAAVAEGAAEGSMLSCV